MIQDQISLEDPLPCSIGSLDQISFYFLPQGGVAINLNYTLLPEKRWSSAWPWYGESYRFANGVYQGKNIGPRECDDMIDPRNLVNKNGLFPTPMPLDIAQKVIGELEKQNLIHQFLEAASQINKDLVY